MARRRLEVRDAVIGTRIACRVSMNQRQRSGARLGVKLTVQNFPGQSRGQGFKLFV